MRLIGFIMQIRMIMKGGDSTMKKLKPQDMENVL